MKKLSWRDALPYIKRVNAELTSILEQAEPPDDCGFYLAEYKYGDNILKNGLFYAPNEKGGLELIDKHHPLYRELGYNLGTNAPGIILSKTMELYVNLDGHSLPFMLYEKGDLIGISKIANPSVARQQFHTGVSIWDMTAGTRSCFMLPKISQGQKHLRLVKTFGLTQDTPRRLADQFSVFREIAAESDWKMQILWFSPEWFEGNFYRSCDKLVNFFLRDLFKRHEFWASSYPWNLTFSRIYSRRNMKNIGPISAFVKHIFDVASGHILVHTPVVDEDQLPLTCIQSAYVDIYGLKDYEPIVMALSKFTKSPAYISLQYPTIDLQLDVESASSSVSLLDNIAHNFTRMVKAMQPQNYQLDWSPLHDVIRSTSVSFHHPYSEKYKNIESIQALFAADNRFNAKFGMELPTTAKFLKGCVSVMRK